MAVKDLEQKIALKSGKKQLKKYWEFKQKIVKLNADIQVEPTFL